GAGGGDAVAVGGGQPDSGLAAVEQLHRFLAALRAGNRVRHLRELLAVTPDAGFGAVDVQLEPLGVVMLRQARQRAAGGVVVGDARDDVGDLRLLVVPLDARRRRPAGALGDAVVLGGDELAVFAIAGEGAA